MMKNNMPDAPEEAETAPLIVTDDESMVVTDESSTTENPRWKNKTKTVAFYV